MDRYFYHGIEAYPGVMGWAVQLMIKILNEGIIVRNQARNFNDDKFNHVCLYRKNEEYDYEGKEGSLNSARDGWIDNCFVFVVSPEIEARKATSEETNLVDEWRCYSNISPDKIVGVAIPFSYIDEYFKDDCFQDEEDRQLLREALKKLKEMCSQLNIPIYDSQRKNFTDELDAKLQKTKVK